MGNYETHFDLAAMPFEYGGFLGAIAIAVVAIGYGAYRVHKTKLSFWAFLRNYKALALVAVGTFLIGYSVRESWDFVWMRSNAASGQVERAEGVVEDHWIKTPRAGEIFEHFRVGDVEFLFKHRDGDEAFFNNSGRQATKLRDGMQLRIAYLVMGTNNRIVKLEIAR